MVRARTIGHPAQGKARRVTNEGAPRRVDEVRCDDHRLIVDLKDGRTISVPLAWYPRLFDATPQQRAHWEPCAAGYGIHWPDIDEHLSTEGLLRGAPAPGWKAAA